MSDDLDFMPAEPAKGADEDTSTSSKALAKTDDGAPAGDPAAPGERAELPSWNRSRKKRKANVKAEQADDGFQRGVRKAGRQFVDTPKLVIGGIVLFLLVIAGGVGMNKRGKVADAEAARTLKSATAAIVRGQVIPMDEREGKEELIERSPYPIFVDEDERNAAVIESLEAAKSGGRDRVAEDATLVAAAFAMRQGDFEAAGEEYTTFLAEVDEDHPLRFLALEGKGLALEAEGELDAALAAFEALAPRSSDFYRHMALYHQGRVLEALDRKDDALAVYQTFFEEFPLEVMATPLIRDRVELLDPEFAARLATPPSTGMPGMR